MPTDVRVTRTGELVTVSLTGRLTIQGVPHVRGVLLKCLTDCPTGLIIDLTGLSVDSDLPLVVFPTVARHARAWPGAPPVVLCAPPGPIADRFSRWHLRRFLPVHGDRAHALAAFDDPDGTPPAVRVELPSGPQAQSQARRLISAACVDWGLPHLSWPAELIVSELAGNAIRHGAQPIGLVAAARPRYLHIVARDGDPRLPRRLDVPSGVLPVAGYGLRLVDAVATAWGCLRTTGGKAVWATLRRDAFAWPPRLATRRPRLARAT